MGRVIPIGVVVLACGLRGNAATLFVDLSRGAGAGGADHADIQSAIDAAADGDTVLVKPGEYLVCAPLTFRGKAITVRAEEGPDRTTVRRCEPPDAEEEQMVVAFRQGEGEGSVLEGFTVAGYAEDLGQQPFGLRSFFGGGILFEGTARPTLRDCVIAGNEAEYGGGIACREDSAPRISRCTISWNNAWGGGGVYVEGGSPVLEDCTILGNAAQMPDTGGGGVDLIGGSPRFVRCRIAGNFGGCGSAVHVDDASPVFENCTISGHPYYAIEVGCWGATGPMFVNCTISGNDVDYPVCHRFEPRFFLNSILSSNWQYGGNPWNDGAPNLGDGDPLFLSAGTFDRERWETVALAGRLIRAPHFILEEPDFHLRPGSPAIDAGTSEGAPATDIEGNPRPSGLGVDLGAYEFRECPLCMHFRRGDSNADGKFDISDPVATLGYLFLGSGALPCLDAADADDSGTLEITDAVYGLAFLFLGGPTPPGPFPACGVDPTPSDLSCEAYARCQ